jgi:hypothetical protein
MVMLASSSPSIKRANEFTVWFLSAYQKAQFPNRKYRPQSAKRCSKIVREVTLK